MDGDLKFHRQAAYVVTIASQNLSLIRRSFQLIDYVIPPLLFKTGPTNLDYGCTIWGPFNRADQKYVERVQ